MKRTKLGLLTVIFLSLVMLVSCGEDEQANGQTGARSMLSLVPEDTIFFLGGLEPLPLQKLLQWNAGHFSMPEELDPLGMFETTDQSGNAGQRMAVQLWAEYTAMAMSPRKHLESWGIDAEPRFASYAIGLAPVLLRISLNDVQRFNAKIDDLEKKARAETQPQTMGEATYRRYVLNHKDPFVSLVIGVDRRHAVFVLDLGVNSEQTLAMALGQEKPERSLAQSERLESMQETYGLHPSVIGFLDHRQLVTGLTTENGNRMASMIQALKPQLRDVPDDLAELRAEGCRNDLTSMVDTWPQTVLGYTALDLSGKPSHMDSLMVVECRDQELLKGLQSLRGFLPDYVRKTDEPAVFSYGIGLNVEKVLPFLTRQWTDLTQKQYSCSFLKDMQHDLRTHHPATLNRALAMAAGVRGIAVTLLSLEMGETDSAAGAMPQDVDALITLSAQNPAALLRTASAMFPPLAAYQIPADGTPVALPLPLPVPVTPKVAIHGSHLTVYAGDRAEKLSKGLDTASLESSSGFMAATFDYSQYFRLFEGMVSGIGQDKEHKEQAMAILEAMKNTQLRFRMEVDFTERGLEARAQMTSMD